MHLYKMFHFAELHKDKPQCCISPTAVFHHSSFPYLTFTQLSITATSKGCIQMSYSSTNFTYLQFNIYMAQAANLLFKSHSHQCHETELSSPAQICI